MSNVKVSTKQFYFSRFGGFAGLAYVLEDDLQDIPNLTDGELTRPGSYLNVTIAEIQSHGHDKYTVYFASGESYLHHERMSSLSSPHLATLLRLGPGGIIRNLVLSLRHGRYTAGYLNGEYYLIAPDKSMEMEFMPPMELQTYCMYRGINLVPLCVHEIKV